MDPTLTASASLCVQAPPPPPRGSGFDPAQPEELELWQLQQGLARDREYHHVAKRKAGTCCGFPLLGSHVLLFAAAGVVLERAVQE